MIHSVPITCEAEVYNLAKHAMDRLDKEEEQSPSHLRANDPLPAPDPYSQPLPPLPDTYYHSTTEPQGHLDPHSRGAPQSCLADPGNPWPDGFSVSPWALNDPSQMGHMHMTDITTPGEASYLPLHQPDHLGQPVPGYHTQETHQMNWNAPIMLGDHSSMCNPPPPLASGKSYPPFLVTQKKKQIRATQV